MIIEPDEPMTCEELSRLNRRWGNRPPEVMTGDEYAELREIWEGKVAQLRDTHPHFGDNDARLAAARLFPGISGELLSHPTRVSMAAKIK